MLAHAPHACTRTPRQSGLRQRCKFNVERVRVRCSANSKQRPEEALQQACEELGAVYSKEERIEEDDEDWEDIMEEMEDFWMRDPKAATEFETGDSNTAEQKSPPRAAMEEVSMAQLEELISAGEGTVRILDTGLEEASRRFMESNIPTAERWAIIHVSLQQLHKEAAESLKEWDTIVVAGSTGAQVRQAYIRLTEVFGLKNVKALADP